MYLGKLRHSDGPLKREVGPSRVQEGEGPCLHKDVDFKAIVIIIVSLAFIGFLIGFSFGQSVGYDKGYNQSLLPCVKR